MVDVYNSNANKFDDDFTIILSHIFLEKLIFIDRKFLTSEAARLCTLLELDAVPCCESAVAFTGSKGEKPKLAANLGMFGFHLGPNNCNTLVNEFIVI